MRLKRIFPFVVLFIFVLLILSCSSTKHIPEDSFILEKVKLKTQDKKIDITKLSPYIKQQPNSRWFSLVKVPLSVYNLSGKDSTKWINRTLRRIGEKPVIYSSNLALNTQKDLTQALINMGYLNAEVNVKNQTKRKKLTVIYELKPGTLYSIKSINYNINDSTIEKLLSENDWKESLIQKDVPFSVALLDNERKRITNVLMNNGYYKFHKDFISYEADSVRGTNKINITLNIHPYQPGNNVKENQHKKYHIDKINYFSNDTTNIHLRRNVLKRNTSIKPDNIFKQRELQQTYNNFARLQAVRYTNIKLKENPDTTLLDADITVITNKPSTISFQPEGTNTAGDLGAAASLIYENKNIFHGSEVLTLQARLAYEAITGLEGYNNEDYKEYSIESRLSFPTFLVPFLFKRVKQGTLSTSELSISWNMQNRPEFQRRIFTSAWRYRWGIPNSHWSYRLDLLNLNYIYMPWISDTFRQQYLDDVNNRNSILRFNYENLFIMKLGFGLNYNDGTNSLRFNIETSGNILNAISHIAKMSKNENGQYTIVNIAYAQYAKFDFDYTRIFNFDERNSIVTHFTFGIAYPYSNSKILPFEKRYFTGGANSLRGWNVRSVGPGRYRGLDGRINFINQTGDVKLDMSLEYRTFLGWKLYGAAFIDAGNIWTLREYAEQEGGKWKWNKFYQQIAASYGLGFRLNFDYFILRFDFGMKAINPAYENQKEHYAIMHPNLKNNFTFHFAVGLPF